MMMLIHGDLIDQAWPTAGPLLQPAIDRSSGYFSSEMVYAAIKNGTKQLWMPHSEEIVYAALVTSINILACGERVLSVDFIGGHELSEWKDEFLMTVHNWAKLQGCAYMEGSGRAGWGKVLRSYDYIPIATTYRKSLIQQVH